MSRTGLTLALIVALVLIALRLFFKVRAVRRSRAETWDEQMIAQLRSQGYAPFNDYRVDFFLALPDAAACERARTRLEPEFSVDSKPMQEEGADLGYSLHASKTMRLIVPEMQEISRRLTALATELGGRYDGWVAA
ncbi:MAG: ribonuclease E inhibitor RraB [Gammaproteobacteria bacterium]|nr:ribonuclease E inhibitor RraB [Gammaproteobacteria bacterium]MBV9696021.1 ribonuclease E inhibitor RraB [Gammaproteobacteria bacterium]